MFSTFTIRGNGTGISSGADPTQPARELIIRSEDLRRLEDTGTGGCWISWEEPDDDRRFRSCLVEGTARENLERLRREELDAIDKAQRTQQRQQQGLPILPVQRGRMP